VDSAALRDLKVMSGARIFFLHQSVGFNIMDGFSRLAGPDTGLRIVNVDENAVGDGPVFAHSTEGRNAAPKSKIDAFGRILRQQKDLQPDVALMKLCYVDFNPETDAEELFDYYAKQIETLKAELPGVVFAHTTAPLKKWGTGIKDTINRKLGRMVWEDESNARRAEYNKLLTERFGADPIIDVARAESTRLDGSRVTFSLDGKDYFAMEPSYTDDGGHLNVLGQRIVAKEFVRVLAEVLSAPEP
jgi:lysophospholipase L1-like esterase